MKAAPFAMAKGWARETITSPFACRSYRATVDFLRSKGYREDAGALDLQRMILQPHATAGFPQIYIVDPDRHIIEINAGKLD